MTEENVEFPTPSFWVIDYWNDGDKYHSRTQNIYSEEEVWKKHAELFDFDNRRIIEVFFHVTSAIGIEAATDVDTRDLIYLQ